MFTLSSLPLFLYSSLQYTCQYQAYAESSVYTQGDTRVFPFAFSNTLSVPLSMFFTLFLLWPSLNTFDCSLNIFSCCYSCHPPSSPWYSDLVSVYTSIHFVSQALPLISGQSCDHLTHLFSPKQLKRVIGLYLMVNLFPVKIIYAIA